MKQTQEVLSAIGSAYCALKRLLGKHHKHNKMLTIGREGKRKEIQSTYTKRVIEAGILNRDPGGLEHL